VVKIVYASYKDLTKKDDCKELKHSETEEKKSKIEEELEAIKKNLLIIMEEKKKNIEKEADEKIKPETKKK